MNEKKGSQEKEKRDAEIMKIETKIKNHDKNQERNQERKKRRGK